MCLVSFGGCHPRVPKEACASLESELLAGGPPSVDNVVGEAPFVETVVVPLVSTRQFNLLIGGPRRPRGHDRLVLKLLVKPMKWDHPPMDASASGSDAAQSIINHWNPFNQRDAFVADMHELYPTNLRIPEVALSKEYSIPFPDYLEKKSYQRVVEDGMYIRNHDFNETAELVWLDFQSLDHESHAMVFF